MRCVATAANASGRNGSFAISADIRPSKPAASAAFAAAPTARQSFRGTLVSTRIAGLRIREGCEYTTQIGALAI